MRLRFVVYRYEAILLILALVLTGSINIISKEPESLFLSQFRYPYCVALTFDDGPYPGYTEKLLEVLETKNVIATFFVIGKNVESHPELLNLIALKGHEIAGHTYNHPNLTKISNRKIISQLESTRNIIKNTTGFNTFLFRPPGGRYNKRVREIANKYGYKLVLWTVLPKDHDLSITKDIITRRVLNETKNHGVVLLHEGKEQTLNALPDIIDKLRSKGYRFVSVSEFLKEKQQFLLVKK